MPERRSGDPNRGPRTRRFARHERGASPAAGGISELIGAVHQLTQAVSTEPTAPDPVAVADEAVRALARITGLPACAIYLADRAAGEARCLAQRGYAADFLARYGALPLGGDTLTGRAVHSGEPQYTGLVDPLPATVDVLQSTGANTFIIVPFRSGGDVAGTINIVGTREAPPSADEVALLQVFADQVGHAVLAAQLQRDGERAQQRARFLADVSRTFNATLDLPLVLATVAERATRVLADWCVIYLREGDLMQMRAVHHADPARARIVRDVFAARPVRVGEGVAGMVVLSGEPRIFPEFGEEQIRTLASRDDPAYMHELRQVRSWACLPLSSHGEGVGALVIATVGRRLTDDDVEFAGGFAEIAATAIANARLFETERSSREFAEVAQARLEEADRLKDEFLSVASHELRTPLTSAHGFAQVLLRRLGRRPDPDPREIEALTTIETQLRRMAALLNDLIDFTHIQSGALPLRPAPVDLRALARTVVERIRAALGEERIALSVPDEPVAGVWDGVRIDQVISNLVENAVKYSPGGDPVEVSVGREDGWATVRVRDFGLGIPAESVPRLFERFYRVPNKEHQEISGIGIGLYICRRIAERHGGTIGLEQPDGAGSLFVLRLPIGEAGGSGQ